MLFLLVFQSTQNEVVRFIQVIFYPRGKKTVRQPGVRFTVSALWRFFYVSLLGKLPGPYVFVHLRHVSALEHVRFNQVLLWVEKAVVARFIKLMILFLGERLSSQVALKYTLRGLIFALIKFREFFGFSRKLIHPKFLRSGYSRKLIHAK